MVYTKPTPRVLKTFLLFCGVIETLFAVEFGSFLLTIGNDAPLEQADVIVALRGSEARVKAGYALASQGLANALIVSPATKDQLNRYTKKYHLPIPAQSGFG